VDKLQGITAGDITVTTVILDFKVLISASVLLSSVPHMQCLVSYLATDFF
jgi:hypothetical protein